MHGAQLECGEGTHAPVPVDEACGVSVRVFANAQVRPAFNKAQAPFGVRPTVGPAPFTARLIGEVELLDSVLNRVHAVECALDAGVVLRLAALVALGDITLAGARLALRGRGVCLQPFEAVHKRSFRLFSPVVAALGLGGHVHGALSLRAGLIPRHHVQVVHDGLAQARVVSGPHHILQRDDDTHAGLVGRGGVGAVYDAAHAQGLDALHQLVDGVPVCVVAVQDDSAPVDHVALTARLGVVEEAACDVVAAVFGGLLLHVLGLEDGHELVGGEPTFLH